MGEVYFYHLTRRPVEETAAVLLAKCLGAGWRVALRGRDAERLKMLDEKLWLQGGKDSFLPHGLADAPHAEHQPIVLTTGPAPNDPTAIMAVDGAEVASDEVAALQRAMILFDGTDGDAVAHARTQWKSLTDAGVAARYWSEEAGKWEEKATKNTA